MVKYITGLFPYTKINMSQATKHSPNLFRPIAIIICAGIVFSSFTYYIFSPGWPWENQREISYADIVDIPLHGILPLVKPGVYKKPRHLPVMRGIEINPENPRALKFYFDPMDKTNVNKKEISRMIRYFFGFLTIPEDALWVNLSPYEKDRIIPDALAQTDIGKDMLLEDYLLKQFTASLTDPNTPHGKKFWDEIHSISYALAQTTKIPINTFNKVWIVPGKTTIYKKGNTCFVKEITLNVMLDEDYQAAKENSDNGIRFTGDKKIAAEINKQAKEVFKRRLLPIIEDQINNSVSFAPLRQLYHTLILANYFKRKLKTNALYRNYINQGKTRFIALHNSSKIKRIIYNSYVNSFRHGNRGTFKYEHSRDIKGKAKREYFSGGIIGKGMTGEKTDTPPQQNNYVVVTCDVDSAHPQTPVAQNRPARMYSELLLNESFGAQLFSANPAGEKCIPQSNTQQALALTEITNRSLELLEKVIAASDLKPYWQTICNDPLNKKIGLKAAKNLSAPAERYDTDERAVIVFNEQFISDLLAGGNAYPAATAIILAEQLFNQLGRTNQSDIPLLIREEARMRIEQNIVLHLLIEKSGLQKNVSDYRAKMNDKDTGNKTNFPSEFYLNESIRNKLMPIVRQRQEIKDTGPIFNPNTMKVLTTSGADNILQEEITKHLNTYYSHPVQQPDKKMKSIRMSTLPGRLQHSERAIEELLQQFSSPATVWDIGIGWDYKEGPVTTKELAQRLGEKAHIYGVDIQMPSYEVTIQLPSGSQTNLVFNEDDHIIAWQEGTSVIDINEKDIQEKVILGYSLRKLALQNNKKEYAYKDSRGITYTIHLDVLKKHVCNNLTYRKADLFNLAGSLGEEENIPKAHVVRISNVIIPHYSLASIHDALTSLLPFVHDNGYILIGFATSMFKREEEYLLYRKRGNTFVLENYLFSAEVDNGGISFGAHVGFAKTDFPIGLLEDDLLKLVYAWDKWETLKFAIVNNQILSDWESRRLSWSKKTAHFLAAQLTQNGIPAQSLSTMISLALPFDSSGSDGNPLRKKMNNAFQSQYFDKSVPWKVESKNTADILSDKPETTKHDAALNKEKGGIDFTPAWQKTINPVRSAADKRSVSQNHQELTFMISGIEKKKIEWGKD